MLNKEFFGDEKSQQIARLKYCIAKFKQYDEERKEYIAQLIDIIKTLEGENFKEGDIEKFRKYKAYKKKCARLEREVERLKLVIQAGNAKEGKTEGVFDNQESTTNKN